MALQIRRGTNAERLTITPAEGELIYTTDTKLIYVGDGSTAGGTKADTGISSLLEDSTPQLGGSLDLNSQNIDGTGNIDITGTISATQIDADVTGSVFADNSTLLVDAVSGKIVGPVEANVTGNLTGDVTGNLTGNVTGDVTGNLTGNASGNHTGTFTGEVSGSVYADDSTQIIDGLTGIVNTTQANVTTLETNVLNDRDNSGVLTVNLDNTGGQAQPRIVLESNGTAGSGLWITTNDTTRTLAGTDNIGRILFRSIDAGGTETPVVAIARKDEFIIAVGAKNTAETFHIATATGNYGLGAEPTADKLTVGGNATITGFTSTDLVGGVYSNDSTQIIDGSTGRIVNLAFTGEVGNTPTDTGTVDSWLEVTVNGNTKYIPLYA